jgi:hypothetical protein
MEIEVARSGSSKDVGSETVCLLCESLSDRENMNEICEELTCRKSQMRTRVVSLGLIKVI